MKSNLTERQMEMAKELDIKALLDEAMRDELYQTLHRCNSIINKTLSQLCDYSEAIEHNKNITCASEYKPICLRDRIERALLVERAHNYKFMIVYMTTIMEMDPEDYFRVANIETDLSWEEFVDAYIRMCS